MLFVSVTLEYMTLSNRLQQLENTMSTSVETALDVSMASEELFTEKFGRNVISRGGKLNSPDSFNASVQIRYYNSNSNELVAGSPYVMSMFYEQYGRFPKDASEYYRFLRNNITEDTVFSWLFGGSRRTDIAGSEYTKLDWYRTNPQTVKASLADESISNERLAQSDSKFVDFVRNMGCQMTTVMPLKKYEPDGTFSIYNKCVPTLANMGINFGDGAYAKNRFIGTDNTRNYAIASDNHVTRQGMHDNFIMSKHVGKSSSNSGVTTSRYYLTPYSLGVTYVPTEVYKPVLMSHIQQACLFNKLKSKPLDSYGDSITHSNSVIKTFDSAIGCIPTNIYNNSSTPVQHGNKGGRENIVNDGYIEYDLNSIECRVDYKMLDFYDEANKEVVTRVLGTKAANNGETADTAQSETVNELENSDTMMYHYNGDDRGPLLTNTGYKPGNRIVARVTTKVKIHIPYNSPILQWLDYLKGTPNCHYGIKLFNTDNGSIREFDDGLWYQYTTYRAISR